MFIYILNFKFFYVCIIEYCSKMAASQTDAKIWLPECLKMHQMGIYVPVGALSRLCRTFPYLSPGKADVTTPSRLWHSARWLKCSLTPMRPGDEICHTPLLLPHGYACEIWRRRCINPRARGIGQRPPGPTCDKQYTIYHLSCAR